MYLDEWSDSQFKRFLNITLYADGEYFNLGLSSITGSFNKENLQNLINSKLDYFGLNLNHHIIAVVSDGCALMKTIRSLFKGPQILCLVHAIHFGIVSTLYSKIGDSRMKMRIKMNNVDGNLFEDVSDDSDIFSDDCFLSDEDESIGYSFDFESDAGSKLVKNVEFDVEDLLSKVRMVIKNINKSSLKREKLNGKILRLDVKTRWNSMISMLESIINAWIEVYEISINNSFEESMCLDNHDFSFIQCLIGVLKPLETVIKKLSSTELTFAKGLLTVDYLQEMLEEMSDELSKNLLHNIKEKLK